MLLPQIKPIGLHTPTAAVLTQLMRCLADGVCRPPTIWIGCPWHCRVSLTSCLQGWRARYVLGLPPVGARAASETPGAKSGVIELPAAANERPSDCVVRLPDLKLDWPTDRQSEIVRVYVVEQEPPELLLVPGAMFDLMV